MSDAELKAHRTKSEIVRDLFMSCLFDDGEPTDGAVMVEGITITVGFHPGRLAERKDEIRKIAAITCVRARTFLLRKERSKLR